MPAPAPCPKTNVACGWSGDNQSAETWMVSTAIFSAFAASAFTSKCDQQGRRSSSPISRLSDAGCIRFLEHRYRRDRSQHDKRDLSFG
jgi:hypothetical protein